MALSIYRWLRAYMPWLVRAYYGIRYGSIRRAMVARLMEGEDVVQPRRFVQPASWVYRLGLLQVVPEAQLIPTGYRVFMRAPNRFVYIAAPIGLHWLFGLGRYLWERSYTGMFPQVLADAYARGRQEGYAERSQRALVDEERIVDTVGRVAFEKGRQAGWDAAFAHLTTTLDQQAADRQKAYEQ